MADAPAAVAESEVPSTRMLAEHHLSRDHEPGHARIAYVSTGWATPLGLAQTVGAQPSVWVVPRNSDWGLRGLKQKTFHVREGLRVAWRARRFPVLVVCTACIEALVVGLVGRVLAPRQRRVAVDFLMPGTRRVPHLIGFALRGFTTIACIRRNDRRVLARRFGVCEAQTTFVPFAVDCVDSPSPRAMKNDSAGYIYSAGSAYRDWRTLFDAVAQIDRPTICATGTIATGDLPAPLPERLTILSGDSFPSPSDGRRLAADAVIIVVSMLDTDLPAGPLVLLDAMALGQPIVATATAGTIDYIVDGVNGVLVPPGDAKSMSSAIQGLLDDPETRARLGTQARQDWERLYTFAAFGQRMSELIAAAHERRQVTASSTDV